MYQKEIPNYPKRVSSKLSRFTGKHNTKESNFGLIKKELNKFEHNNKNIISNILFVNKKEVENKAEIVIITEIEQV